MIAQKQKVFSQTIFYRFIIILLFFLTIFCSNYHFIAAPQQQRQPAYENPSTDLSNVGEGYNSHKNLSKKVFYYFFTFFYHLFLENF